MQLRTPNGLFSSLHVSDSFIFKLQSCTFKESSIYYYLLLFTIYPIKSCCSGSCPGYKCWPPVRDTPVLWPHQTVLIRFISTTQTKKTIRNIQTLTHIYSCLEQGFSVVVWTSIYCHCDSLLLLLAGARQKYVYWWLGNMIGTLIGTCNLDSGFQYFSFTLM